jgi:hypothetical protein
VPGFDQLAVDHSLAANGVEPGAMQEGTLQRVVGERLVEPGEGRGGLGQGAGERRIRGRPGLQPGVEHSPLSVCLCTPRVRCTAAPIAGKSEIYHVLMFYGPIRQIAALFSGSPLPCSFDVSYLR